MLGDEAVGARTGGSWLEGDEVEWRRTWEELISSWIGTRMVVDCCHLGGTEIQGGGRRMIGEMGLGGSRGGGGWPGGFFWIGSDPKEESGGGRLGRGGWMGQPKSRVRLL